MNENDRWTAVDDVLTEVRQERASQEAKWGQQDHPFLYNPGRPLLWGNVHSEALAKRMVDDLAKDGMLDYAGIVTEEYHESLEAKTPEKQREELLQLAACCVAAIESIDRNGR